MTTLMRLFLVYVTVTIISIFFDAAMAQVVIPPSTTPSKTPQRMLVETFRIESIAGEIIIFPPHADHPVPLSSYTRPGWQVYAYDVKMVPNYGYVVVYSIPKN